MNEMYYHTPRDSALRTHRATPASARLAPMSLPAVPEPCEPERDAEVIRFPYQGDPTPAEVAAKKARRRLGEVIYERTQAGGYAARYFNQDGFDTYGRDARGNYDPTQRDTDLPTRFTH